MIIYQESLLKTANRVSHQILSSDGFNPKALTVFCYNQTIFYFYTALDTSASSFNF